jgi:Rieske Fe-S protein
MAAQYRDLVTPGEVASVDEVPRGEGRIVRVGMAKHAVYRDDEGVLHARQANCPHLGAVVRWNRLEKSWDCPAHGSRFEPCAGACLNGPAPHGLAAVDD